MPVRIDQPMGGESTPLAFSAPPVGACFLRPQPQPAAASPFRPVFAPPVLSPVFPPERGSRRSQ